LTQNYRKDENISKIVKKPEELKEEKLKVERRKKSEKSMKNT